MLFIYFELLTYLLKMCSFLKTINATDLIYCDIRQHSYIKLSSFFFAVSPRDIQSEYLHLCCRTLWVALDLLYMLFLWVPLCGFYQVVIQIHKWTISYLSSRNAEALVKISTEVHWIDWLRMLRKCPTTLKISIDDSQLNTLIKYS